MQKIRPLMRLVIAAWLFIGLLPAGGAGAAGPNLVLTPSSGACGTPVQVLGTGWPAGLALIVQGGTDNGPILGRAIVAADGTFTLQVRPCAAGGGEPAGSAIAIIASPDKATGGNPPPVQGRATFTVFAAGCRTFPETGKTVCGPFLAYWLSHGGLMQQGYPISDQREDRSDTDGKRYQMQYFERAVFELHPDNTAPYQVLLSLLGAELYNIKYPGGAPGQHPNTAPGSQFFQTTGHRVGGAFLTYWQQHGGLAQQGYPLSDEFQERSPLDGKTYTVQYFERAIFEHHPENAPPFDVLLSQLGTFRYRDRSGGAPGGYPGKIVFDTVGPDLAPTISVINPDGTGRAQVARGRSPLFAPDGARIAYLAVQAPAGSPGAPFGRVAIRVANLDGSASKDLCPTDGNAQLDLVRWSAGNSYIALSAGQNPPGNIYLCDVRTNTLGTAFMATQGLAVRLFDWTPNEQEGLWEAPAPGMGWQVYYGNVGNTMNPTRVTNGGNMANRFGQLIYTDARLAPDGRTIAVAGSKVFFMDVPGQNSPLFGKSIEGLGQPERLAWSPDGRALAVVDGAAHTLNVVDVATGRITHLADGVGQADWAAR